MGDRESVAGFVRIPFACHQEFWRLPLRSANPTTFSESHYIQRIPLHSLSMAMISLMFTHRIKPGWATFWFSFSGPSAQFFLQLFVDLGEQALLVRFAL